MARYISLFGHFTLVHTSLFSFTFIFGYPLQARRWIRTVSCSAQIFLSLVTYPHFYLDSAMFFLWLLFSFFFGSIYRSLPKISIQLKSNLEHIKLLLSCHCNKDSVIYGKSTKGLASSCTLFDCFSNPNARMYYTILGLDSEY